ncbi:MAG: APC family permease [Candidatus Njordarchaeales archaeon]
MSESSSGETSLKRALGLGYTTFFGVGLILGAGIYVLIGRAAAFVGDAVWVSVLFATLIALTTGLSYAELASMYPFASSTHKYVEEAFPKIPTLAFVAGWLIAFEGIAGAATAAIGFARYFVSLIDSINAPGFPYLTEMMIPWIAIIMIILLSVINWWGIEESALLTLIFTIVEAGGLVLVATLGFLLPQREPQYLHIPTGFNPFLAVMLGAAVFYFAFTGFELQPTLSEEAKDPERTVPKAIILALLICSLLYLLVSLAVVKLLPWDVLRDSKAPLADAARAAWPGSYLVLMAIALFSTTNTILGFLVSSSRLIYGLASEGVLYKKLSKVDRWRRTPYIAVAVTGIISVLVVLITLYVPMITGWKVVVGNVEYELIDLVGKTASLSCLIAFIVVNISVIVLRYTKPNHPRKFRIPLSIKNFPILSAIAALLTLMFILTSFLDWIVWLTTLIVLLIGLVFYYLERK